MMWTTDLGVLLIVYGMFAGWIRRKEMAPGVRNRQTVSICRFVSVSFSSFHTCEEQVYQFKRGLTSPARQFDRESSDLMPIWLTVTCLPGGSILIIVNTVFRALKWQNSTKIMKTIGQRRVQRVAVNHYLSAGGEQCCQKVLKMYVTRTHGSHPQ